MKKSDGSVRRRRGEDDDGGRVVPLPEKKHKKVPKSQKPGLILRILGSTPVKIVLGLLGSLIIAGLLTNRIINAPIKAVEFEYVLLEFLTFIYSIFFQSRRQDSVGRSSCCQ